MKKILFTLVTIIGVLLIYATYMYFKPHKNIKIAKEDFSITAPNLYQAYTDNENKANEKYLDKLVLISGIIDEISVDDSSYVNLYLDVASEGIGSVSCNFSPIDGKKALNYKVGMEVKVKGICTGYLMDVVLNKCVIVD